MDISKSIEQQLVGLSDLNNQKKIEKINDLIFDLSLPISLLLPLKESFDFLFEKKIYIINERNKSVESFNYIYTNYSDKEKKKIYIILLVFMIINKELEKSILNLMFKNILMYFINEIKKKNRNIKEKIKFIRNLKIENKSDNGSNLFFYKNKESLKNIFFEILKINEKYLSSSNIESNSIIFKNKNLSSQIVEESQFILSDLYNCFKNIDKNYEIYWNNICEKIISILETEKNEIIHNKIFLYFLHYIWYPCIYIFFWNLE